MSPLPGILFWAPIVTHSLGRTAYVYADDIHINVAHTGDERTPAVYPAIPEREPLALITSSDPSPRAVVLDPNTGKHWIPRLASQGMSFSQVLAETRTGRHLRCAKPDPADPAPGPYQPFGYLRYPVESADIAFVPDICIRHVWELHAR